MEPTPPNPSVEAFVRWKEAAVEAIMTEATVNGAQASEFWKVPEGPDPADLELKLEKAHEKMLIDKERLQRRRDEWDEKMAKIVTKVGRKLLMKGVLTPNSKGSLMKEVNTDVADYVATIAKLVKAGKLSDADGKGLKWLCINDKFTLTRNRKKRMSAKLVGDLKLLGVIKE